MVKGMAGRHMSRDYDPSSKSAMKLDRNAIKGGSASNRHQLSLHELARENNGAVRNE